MSRLQGILLTALFLLTISPLSCTQLAIRTSQKPLTPILYETCSTLPSELITLIVSYCEPNPIYCFEILSPSDDMLPKTILAAGHANGEIDLIDATDNLEQQRITIKILKKDKGPITAIKWLAAQKILITASTLNGYAVQTIRAGEHSIRLTAILQNSILPPSQQTINEQVVLWNLASGRPIQIIKSNPQLCMSSLQLLNAKYLVRSTTTGLCFRIISLARSQHALEDYTKKAEVKVDGISSRRTCEKEFGDYTVSGCADGTVFVENARRNRYVHLPKKHVAAIRAIVEIKPGLVATACDNGMVNIYCTKTQTLLQQFDEHETGSIYGLALLINPRGHLLAIATTYGTIQIHKLDDCIDRWENFSKT